MNSAQNKNPKIKELAQRMAKSQAFQDTAALPAEQWEIFLEHCDEEAVKHCEMLLDEEEKTYTEIDQKAEKRHQVNKTRLLHHLEKTLVEAQHLLNKNNG